MNLEGVEYRGYTCSVLEEEGSLVGVLNLSGALVMFESANESNLEKAFRDAVDAYIETMEELGYPVKK